MPQASIEALKQKKEDIRSSLENLKRSTDNNEKERLQRETEEKIQNFYNEISNIHLDNATEQWELDLLKWEVDTCKQELDQVVSQTRSDLADLQQQTQQETPVQQQTSTQQVDQQQVSAQEPEKWFWWKTKDFVSDNWNAAWSWHKWKEEPWTNLLLWGAFIGSGVAVYKWVKKLWNWAFWDKKEKKEWSESASQSWEKKSFWKTWFWKFLKWTGIWVWVGTAGYWLGKKLWWIKSDDVTDRAADQAETTVQLKEKDPEKYEKYKGIWENVDSQYNQVMKKEMDAWWWWMSIADGYEKYADKNNIDKDTFQATVPMCIDNQFSDVSNFLSEGGYYAYLRGLSFNELKNEIIWWGKEKIGKVIGPYLTWLTSFIPFKGKDRSEAINNWFTSWDAAEREAELQLFFRQYAKVLNYTQDKLFSLKEKIAEEKIAHTEGNHSTASDALKDDDWVENYINTDPRYKNFVNGKLHQAVDVMKDNNIFNDALSYDMKKVTSSCDAERDTILNFQDGKDSIQRLEAAWTNLTTEHYREWVECCDKITKDIEDEFDQSFHYLYFSCVHEAINSSENNIQEFMKHSWLTDLKAWLKVSMSEFKQKFASWNITQEEVQLYKNQVNSYFAMKKEVFIWARAIQQMKSDNPNFAERALNIWCAVVKDLLNQTWATLKHLKNEEYVSAWISATIPLYLWWKVLSLAWNKYPAAKKLWYFMERSNIFSVAWTTRWKVMRRVYKENLNGFPDWLLWSRYNIANGDQLLLQDLIEWKIHWDTATRLIKKWNKNWSNLAEGKATKANSIAEFVQKMMGSDTTSMSAKHLNILFNNKFSGELDIVFMRNPSLRKMIFGEPKISMFEQWKSIWNGYRKKIYNPIGFSNIEVFEEFVIGKNWRTAIFETLSKEQKSFAKQLLEWGQFTKIEDVKWFLGNVKKLRLDWFDDVKIARLVEELIENTEEFSDLTKVEARILNIKNGVVADEVLKSKYSIFSDIDTQKAELSSLRDKSYTDLDELDKRLKSVTEGSSEYDSIKSQMDLIEWKITKQEKAISNLNDFEKELLSWGENKILKVREVVDKLWSKNFTKAMENMAVLAKLEDLKYSSWEKAWQKIYSNLSDVIEKFDFDELKRLWVHFDDVWWETAVKWLKTAISDIRKLKWTRLFSNMNEICDAVKVVKKIAKIL